MRMTPKQQEKRDWIDRLWRQTPAKDYIGTYSGCANKCGNHARGGGFCRGCVVKEIAKVSTMPKAEALRDAIIAFRDDPKDPSKLTEVKRIEQLILSNRRL